MSTWLVPIKAVGTESLMSSLVDDILHISQFTARGIECVPYGFSWRGHLEVCAWFPPGFVPDDFSFC